MGAASSTDIVPGERLSQWLLRQPASPDAYPMGLSWLVPEELPDQQALRAGLISDLAGLKPQRAPQAAALSGWLQRTDATGRAVVLNPDPRWLEVNPSQDPVLQSGQRVVLPVRPGTATVVLEDGALCQVPHRAGVLALDYLRACAPDATQRDTVWIAQPDGRSRRFGIGAWNAEEQETPAPGAWIWAPARSSGFPAGFSDRMIRFLGTLGAAEDGRGRLVGAPPELSRAVPMGRAVDLPRTASDWGEIGLLQTPTARMAPVGDARVHASITQPYTRITFMFQPLDWLEGGFRYTDISNQLYDPSQTISQQSYKDKSIDAKVRLWKESAWLPEVAVGARDIGGTGLFSSEYVVANKRSGNFDVSLGLGWGYVGGRGNLKNPFSLISERFTNRPVTAGTGDTGTTNANAYFRGPTSLFGGVQWQTPIKPLVAKIEYDGNNYRREPFANPITQRSPINVGVVYRYSPAIDFSAGVERGNRLMAGVTLHGGLDALSAPKLLDPAPVAVSTVTPLADPTSWTDTATDIEIQTGWSVQSMRREGPTLRIRIGGARSTMYRSDRLNRLVAVLHRDTASSVQRFTIDFEEHGLAIGSKTIARDDWVALQTQGLSPAQQRNRGGDFSSGPLTSSTPRLSNSSPVWESASGRLKVGLGPSFWQTLGGPDSFLLYQLGVAGAAEYRVTNRTWINAAANLRVIDNYDKFVYTAPSNLPRVRTFAREYVTTSRLTINNLQATHAEQLGDSHFVSAYGGLLESMFGGVGAEYLYRRPGSRWAVGADLNRVRQRGFDQRFSFREYEVTTGHATLYWNTGWNDIDVRVSAGQYLAGDRGATLDLSRRFSNGVAVGAYATKTNVSSAQFGEGSFDKGIYVSFPFDAIVPRSTNANGTIVWTPLTRDGGARLQRSQTLFELTSTRDRRAFQYGPPERPLKTGDAVFN